MTPKPRSMYTDHTRKLRSGRRTAILDAAAVRLGYATWQRFSTEFRKALETAETETQASQNLYALLQYAQAFIGTRTRPPLQPPADIQGILAAYPPRKAGRPKIAKSNTD